MTTLEEIINKTDKQPTIVNETSNFVVITYWWGSTNANQNTARPCPSFFEEITKKVIDISIKYINSLDNLKSLKESLIAKNDLENKIKFLPIYLDVIHKFSNIYLNMIYVYAGLNVRNIRRDADARRFLNKMKETNKTPDTYVFRNISQLTYVFDAILTYVIKINKEQIYKLSEIETNIKNLKDDFLNKNGNKSSEEYKKNISDYEKQKKEARAIIKKNLSSPFDIGSPFNNEQITKYTGKSIYFILNQEFRFINPISYSEMINQWEEACRNYNCNYLSVEYPEFAKPGGYQMAINAKPLFIRKALELCNSKNVLYIDGDMYIRKYPSIFDIQDVDIMARGWWIDPRSSYKFEESITYDPYTFETSGGTMFFSQSESSKSLISSWIVESDKEYQKGKADDRILSMIFNTYKFLLSVKIIQLPIEYLWLTLDYNERLLETIFDYGKQKMLDTIFIEHPECLTSEETASGAGASNDRTPKFYSFLDLGELIPVSEEVHEYVMFPTKEMTSAFKDYYEYMDNITYVDDGNELLYKKGFVDKENPENNVSPLYVIKYDDKFGNKKRNYDGAQLSTNDIVEINVKRATNMNLDNLTESGNIISSSPDFVEIRSENMSEKEIISLVIRLLKDGKTVIYNPTNKTGYDNCYYNLILEKKDNLYRLLEFIYVPKQNKKSFDLSDIFRCGIITEQPMLFRPNNNKLIDLLSMFLSFDDLSDYLEYGCYEFVSRIRIGHLYKKKVSKEKNIELERPILEKLKHKIEENYFKDEPDEPNIPEPEEQEEYPSVSPPPSQEIENSQFGGEGDESEIKDYIEDTIIEKYEIGLEILFGNNRQLSSSSVSSLPPNENEVSPISEDEVNIGGRSRNYSKQKSYKNKRPNNKRTRKNNRWRTKRHR